MRQSVNIDSPFTTDQFYCLKVIQGTSPKFSIIDFTVNFKDA